MNIKLFVSAITLVTCFGLLSCMGKQENSHKTNSAWQDSPNTYINFLLDEGAFVRAGKVDLLFFENTLLYISPQERSFNKKDRMFLHVIESKGDSAFLNKDFYFSDSVIPTSSVLGLENWGISKCTLPSDFYSISTGQFNENGRAWSITLKKENLVNRHRYIYNNEYRLDTVRLKLF